MARRQDRRLFTIHPRTGALWSGMTTPDLWVVALGLALALVAVVGVQVAVTSGAYTVIPRDYLLRDQHDDYLVVSHLVGSLKRHPPTDTPVYLLGGSSANEMIDTPEALSADLRSQSGRPVTAYMLTATYETLGQSLAIVDNLPRGPAVVVVGVDLNAFSHVPSSSDSQLGGKPFLMDSEALRDALAVGWQRRLPQTVWPGVADFVSTYAVMLTGDLRLHRLPPLRYVRHRYTQATTLPLSTKQKMVQTGLENGGPALARNIAANADMLARIAALARERDYTLVLLELPIDDEVIAGAWDAGRATYRTYCVEIARRYGGVYLDFTGQAGLTDHDFGDLLHLVESGRAKWRPRLAAELAPYVRAASAEAPVAAPH